MPRKKLKPGPKRPVGRPATAKRREADTARLRTERQILAEIGVVNVTIWVDEYVADALREASKIKRIEGLIAHAESVGDAAKSTELRAKLALAQIERDRALAARAEQRAEADLLAGEEARRRAVVDASAQRLAQSAAEARQGVSVALPAKTAKAALSDAEIRAAARENNPYLV